MSQGFVERTGLVVVRYECSFRMRELAFESASFPYTEALLL